MNQGVGNLPIETFMIPAFVHTHSPPPLLSLFLSPFFSRTSASYAIQTDAIRDVVQHAYFGRQPDITSEMWFLTIDEYLVTVCNQPQSLVCVYGAYFPSNRRQKFTLTYVRYRTTLHRLFAFSSILMMTSRLQSAAASFLCLHLFSCTSQVSL